MIRTPSELGVWTFSRADRQVEFYDEATLSDLCTLVVDSARVLARHELLLPSRIVLKAWREPLGGAESAVHESSNPDPIDLDGIDLLTGPDQFHTIVGEHARVRGSFPEEIEVVGDGVVLDESGHRDAVPSLVRLTGSAFPDLTAVLSTDVDVWLPYDLAAVQQWAIHERNAPRLRSALMELEAMPGILASHVEMTRYAEVEPHEVRNHIDGFGRAVAVLPRE